MPNEWQGVLDEIRDSVSEMAFKTYFTDFNFSSFEGGVLTASVKNVFYKTQIERKFMPIVEEALANRNYQYKEFRIVENADTPKTSVKRAVEVVPNDDMRSFSNVTKQSSGPSSLSSHSFERKPSGNNETGLNPRYRLSDYVVASNNDLAVHAAEAIIENPGIRFNPFFIYGGSGLGKTHLAQAIGNEIVERYPGKKVLFTTTENFFSSFINSIRSAKVANFTDKYRNLDVLIIDDFQAIIGKEKSQEEFFNTFNELYNANKQIIITCDRMPSQIATIDQRLVSRLEMGMPVDIQMPDFETRMAIAMEKAEALGQALDARVAEWIANNVRGSIRDLEGKLNQVLALAEMRGVDPVELIDDSGAVSHSSLANTHRTISPKVCIERVASFYELSAKDLLGTSRKKDIKDARQVAMYLMNKELKMSTVKIGTEFGKDHTTIMHGIKVVEAGLKGDLKVREQISALREQIYG